MKTLHVLRHGQAAPESLAGSDHARELTRRGEEEVRQSARHLAARAALPSLVVSSSAARARQTAELCLASLPSSTALVVRKDLYLAEPAAYLEALAAGADPHTSVLVVGHNPGLEALVLSLSGRSEHLATASLVELQLPLSTWADLPEDVVGGLGKLVSAFRAR
jgi:phosphohistidine phosphatase